MRPEYDFSAAVRGVTAARYAQGANIAVIDPESVGRLSGQCDGEPDATRARAPSPATTATCSEAEKRLTRHRVRGDGDVARVRGAHTRKAMYVPPAVTR